MSLTFYYTKNTFKKAEFKLSQNLNVLKMCTSERCIVFNTTVYYWYLIIKILTIIVFNNVYMRTTTDISLFSYHSVIIIFL